MKNTVFFDGRCPLCRREMRSLQRNDLSNTIDLIDIHSPAFSKYSQPSFDEAMYELHAFIDGKLLKAADANIAIWQSLGKKKWLILLRLPVIKQLVNLSYRLFARNRYTLSKLITGKPRCNDICEL